MFTYFLVWMCIWLCDSSQLCVVVNMPLYVDEDIDQKTLCLLSDAGLNDLGFSIGRPLIKVVQSFKELSNAGGYR